MTARTAAQLKAEFQGTDPQDFANDVADTAKEAATATLAGVVELATNAEAKAANDSVRAMVPANMLQGAPAAPTNATIKPLFVQHYQLAPAAVSATAVHAAVTLGDDVQDVNTNISNPDFPRNVTVKGNAAGIAGNVVITGTDFAGTAITETIALNETTEVAGTKAFKTVTQIGFPAKTNGSGDTVSVGIGKIFGLPLAISDAARLLVHLFNAAADAGTFTPSATLSACTYAVAGSPDGAKKVDLIYGA